MADTTNAHPSETAVPAPEVLAGITEESLVKNEKPLSKEEHPSGKEGYGTFVQIIRGSCFALYFNSCIFMYAQQVRYRPHHG
jgi:lysocardiolipin and lysophospholipid acyltransferase